ncbi:NADH-quinone oxidoreductase subunit C [Streptomyces sp. NRRL S-87]|uniref:NADH-quinone oxidoreductase subunit C n=1 Tax=Streptomyces sp. NRRL S-87 TaxID=1463920 RepID=UPI0004C03A0B|nr:NADH-quinone oxidoreductase subunit C [Streptomyces sp. NRRL S-87]
MTHPYDLLPEAVTDLFGAEATAEAAYDLLTVDVPTASWISALETARDKLGCTYFDWLSAVDEPGTGFRVAAHVVALEAGRVRRLLLRTTVPHEAAALPSAVAVYAGAAWHERETYEMFGVTFTDHPHLVPLLLPENFEGHPLRKDFVLAARVAKAWPGAKEPGEGAADHAGPKRRTMLPPGVPDPNDWGPMKGQLPPAPTRPARTPRAAGEAPARRARTAAAGSASQPATEGAEAPVRPVRRARTAAQGSASQAAEATAGPEVTPGPGTPAGPAAPAAPEATAGPAAAAGPAGPEAAAAGEGPSRPARPPRRSRSAADGSASQAAAETAGTDTPGTDTPAAPPVRSSDAPWHNPRPAFDDAAQAPAPQPGAERPEPEPKPEPEAGPEPEPEAAPEPAAGPEPEPRKPTTDPDNDTGGDA